METQDARALREALETAGSHSIYRADGTIDNAQLQLWRHALHLAIARDGVGPAAVFPLESRRWGQSMAVSAGASIFGDSAYPVAYTMSSHHSAACAISSIAAEDAAPSRPRAHGAIYAVAAATRDRRGQASGKSPAEALAAIGLNTHEMMTVGEARLRLDHGMISADTARLIDELPGDGALLVSNHMDATTDGADEFESDRWIGEACELHRKAAKCADDARRSLLERADAYTEQAHVKVLRQYNAMLAKAEVQQLFGRQETAHIRSGLGDAVGVLRKSQSGAMTSTAAENILHRMGSGSREIAREIGALATGLGSGNRGVIQAAHQSADQG